MHVNWMGSISFLGSGFAHFFGQIVSVTVKEIGKTNFVASRHIKRKKASLPVDARRFAQQRLCLSFLIPRTTLTETLSALANSSTGIILHSENRAP